MPLQPDLPASPTPTDPMDACRHWLEQAVIGLNLCPFAKAVHVRGRIRWVQVDTADEEQVRQVIEDELTLLAQADPASIDTTLVVLAQALPVFFDFHRFVDSLGSLLKRLRLRGVLQIASFHPDFVFAGVDADDRSHFTNRSPFPIVHLLRESSVSAAVDSFPDPDAIVQANIRCLQQLGADEFRQRFAAAAKPPTAS